MKKEELIKSIERFLIENPGERNELLNEIEDIELSKDEVKKDIENWANSANY
jgi:hypothetical protein